MISEKFGVKFIASIFVARGITGIFFFLSDAVGGMNSLSYGSGLMIFMIVLLGLSSIVVFVSYGLTKQRYWSWLLGTLTVLIYLTTDVSFTALGHPQPIAEFVIDIGLLIYFVLRKDTFEREASGLPDLNEKLEEER